MKKKTGTEIAVDDIVYHISEFSEKEEEYLRACKRKLLAVYPRLPSVVGAAFDPVKESYSDARREDLLACLLLAICKQNKDENAEEWQENKFLKTVYTELRRFLPIVLENERSIFLSRPFIYEPINASSLWLLNRMQAAFRSFYENTELSETDSACMVLINNTVRSLKSSLLLFSVGDDIHGYALLRGILEQVARLTVLVTGKKETENDYARFLAVNAIVQKQKQKAPVSPEEAETVRAFFAEYKTANTNVENFLLYGWVKNARGRRITNAQELLRVAFPKQAEELYGIWHFASEFIHEDTVGVKYDYVTLRKNMKKYLAEWTLTVWETERELGIPFAKDVLPVTAYLREKTK